MSKLFAFCAAFLAALVFLAGTAGAQQKSSVNAFSQGVSAHWDVGTAPNGDPIRASFGFSGGGDYSHREYGTSSPVTSVSNRDYWYFYQKYQCPAEGGVCVTLSEDYGPVGNVFSFSSTAVTFSGNGYKFSFSIDPVRTEGRTSEGKFNQTTDGPWCWYARQNVLREGFATLSVPSGEVFSSGQSRFSSAWQDWNIEASQGKFIFSCAPYYGGGKG
jgi:hypothetical protein